MKRHRIMPEIELDRSSLRSLREQIGSQIAAGIRAGMLPNGALLPSSRLLAKLLLVSRTTVVGAYDDLLEIDLIESRAGSGIRVRSALRNPMADSTLRTTARKAHYPARTIAFEDMDGVSLYLNVLR